MRPGGPQGLRPRARWGALSFAVLVLGVAWDLYDPSGYGFAVALCGLAAGAVVLHLPGN